MSPPHSILAALILFATAAHSYPTATPLDQIASNADALELTLKERSPNPQYWANQMNPAPSDSYPNDPSDIAPDFNHDGAALSKRFPTGNNIVKPFYISQFNPSSQSVTHNPTTGKVSFSGGVTTIFTFNMPSNLAGRKCTIGFSLESRDNSVKLSNGNPVVMVYSRASAPPQMNIRSWTTAGSNRVDHIGNLKLNRNGNADIFETPTSLRDFDCMTMQRAWEVAPRFNVEAEWGNGAGSGMYISYK
ncbi:unnamed protein product [Periconia digitata]|uniref:Ubiquitin 3 binding protein But2 C-terminal domain-containing protein n=1 Tax=Periconia digitata TaxID=1303443 RepID=A0A9W4UKE6_9PLEO|nr:unnamed protein product [Periconia digitata]